VVRAVYESEIPVVSAVGHEVDITLTDLAADFSAATPSMAAEIVAWPLEDFQAAIYGFLRDIHRAAKDMISEGRSRFSDLTRARVFVRPQTMLESRYQFLDNQARLLHLLSDRRFDTFRKALALHLSRLEALSPLRVLARGYSVARSLPDKKVIRSVGDVAPGDRMETIVGDGSLFAVVDETKKADDDDGQKGV
jgi:exodeoxyribonuclease VII large subunit